MALKMYPQQASQRGGGRGGEWIWSVAGSNSLPEEQEEQWSCINHMDQVAHCCSPLTLLTNAQQLSTGHMQSTVSKIARNPGVSNQTKALETNRVQAVQIKAVQSTASFVWLNFIAMPPLAKIREKADSFRISYYLISETLYYITFFLKVFRRKLYIY